jgi:hypothetical protein
VLKEGAVAPEFTWQTADGRSVPECPATTLDKLPELLYTLFSHVGHVDAVIQALRRGTLGSPPAGSVWGRGLYLQGSRLRADRSASSEGNRIADPAMQRSLQPSLESRLEERRPR